MECNHAYKIKRGILLYCLQCNQFLPVSTETTEYKPAILPPKHYQITEILWKQIAPWPLIPFEIVKNYGWYISLIGMDEYLIMPVFQDGKEIFYSARRLTNNGGPKYNYPKGAKRYHWLSSEKLRSPIVFCEGVADAAYVSQIASSIALLGSYYDSSLDDKLAGKHVIILLDGDARGITAAIKLSKQLRIAKSIRILVLEDSKDPTDVPIEELKRRIYVRGKNTQAKI